jgi:hypothetical protein
MFALMQCCCCVIPIRWRTTSAELSTNRPIQEVRTEAAVRLAEESTRLNALPRGSRSLGSESQAALSWRAASNDLVEPVTFGYHQQQDKSRPTWEQQSSLR